MQIWLISDVSGLHGGIRGEGLTEGEHSRSGWRGLVRQQVNLYGLNHVR